MRAIIIEDEAVIRRGIINKVKWEKYQINQVLEADNGETAFEIIVNEKPDIILLDINLPKLNGIELLKKMRMENINSKVIILSGHDEFEYARQAITYGVENYLLKPSSPAQIEEVLAKVSSDIIASSEKERKNEEMKRKLEEMLPFFKSGLVNNVITGNISNEKEIINLSNYLNIDIKKQFHIVTVILVNDMQNTRNNMEKALMDKIEITQLIRNVAAENPVLLDDTFIDKIIMLISGENEAELKRICFSTVNRIVDEAAKIINIPVNAGIGKVYSGIRNIKYSYEEALSALENQFVDSGSRIFYIGDLTLDYYDLSNYPYEYEKNFINHIRLGKKDSAVENLEKIVLFLKTEKDRYPINLIKIHLNQIIYQMAQIIYELGGAVSDLYGNVNIMEYVGKFTHIEEYKEYINVFTDKLCDYIMKKRYIKHNSIIRKIMAYIEENYKDEGMGLEQISENVNMHPNYVSHLFKKEKGESLTSYICQFRINKARDLILKSQSVKVSDIAFEVGFSDSHYFTACFKNIIGVTPTELKSLNKSNIS